MKTAAIALIVGGAVLALAGLLAMSSASSDFSHLIEDSPPDRTRWVMLLGVALFVAGAAAAIRTFRKTVD
jgi:hypothetical protein